MEYAATREDVAEVKLLIERVKVLIERKESTMMRWLLGIMVTATIGVATAVVSVIVALVRTFGSP